MNFLSKTNLIAATALSFGVAAFLQWYKISSICESAYSLCSDLLFNIKIGTGLLFWILFPVVFALFLTHSAFESWKRFAVWAAPTVAILVVGVLLMDTSSSGGWGIPSIDIASLLILPIYAVYFVASLVVIYRAWRRG